MSLGIKRQSGKQQGMRAEQTEFPRLTDESAYRPIADQIGALRSKIEEAESQRSALLEERRLAQSPVAFLKTILDSNGGASLGERIAQLSERILDLAKALQLAEQEADRVRGRLSAEAVSSHSPQYRQQARMVFRGMLDIQLANDAIVAMRESLEEKGYQAGTIVPLGISPWPMWGHVSDPSSYWRMIALEFRERQFISEDEYATIVAGDLTEFRP
jgi:chorismate mutase